MLEKYSNPPLKDYRHEISLDRIGVNEGYCRPCSADDWPDYHEGHSGWTVDMMYKRNAIQLGIGACRKQGANSLYAVVLHIGTNDIIKGEESQSPGSTISELRKVRVLKKYNSL